MLKTESVCLELAIAYFKSIFLSSSNCNIRSCSVGANITGPFLIILLLSSADSDSMLTSVTNFFFPSSQLELGRSISSCLIKTSIFWFSGLQGLVTVYLISS